MVSLWVVHVLVGETVHEWLEEVLPVRLLALCLMDISARSSRNQEIVFGGDGRRKRSTG